MLLLASSVCELFKWRQFEPEVILLAVGWYLRVSLSSVTWRSCLPACTPLRGGYSACAPENSAPIATAAPTNQRQLAHGRNLWASKGKWVYLGGDRLPSLGQTRCSGRQALSGQSLGRRDHLAPRVINTDKDAAYPPDSL